MRVFDAFLFSSELDMLECRLTELGSSRVYRHILVEAPWDHQGRPKPLHYAENRERFSAWADRIIHVILGADEGNQVHPWAREHIQRSFVWEGLGKAGAAKDDVVLICDVDEIPSQAAVACLPEPFISLEMRLHPYAVDWLADVPWKGPVAARAGAVSCFTTARDRRAAYPVLDGGGWHFTWFGGPDAIQAKAQVSCDVNVADGAGRWYRDGLAGAVSHAGAGRLIPVDVDESWPQWICERRCPPSWFRPRARAQNPDRVKAGAC